MVGSINPRDIEAWVAAQAAQAAQAAEAKRASHVYRDAADHDLSIIENYLDHANDPQYLKDHAKEALAAFNDLEKLRNDHPNDLSLGVQKFLNWPLSKVAESFIREISEDGQSPDLYNNRCSLLKSIGTEWNTSDETNAQSAVYRVMHDLGL